MLVYIAVFEKSWRVEEYDSRDIHYIRYDYGCPENTRYTLYKENVGHYGPIWHGKQIYTTREGAWAYVYRNYDLANNYLWDELRYNK